MYSFCQLTVKRDDWRDDWQPYFIQCKDCSCAAIIINLVYAVVFVQLSWLSRGHSLARVVDDDFFVFKSMQAMLIIAIARRTLSGCCSNNVCLVSMNCRHLSAILFRTIAIYEYEQPIHSIVTAKKGTLCQLSGYFIDPDNIYRRTAWPVCCGYQWPSIDTHISGAIVAQQ